MTDGQWRIPTTAVRAYLEWQRDGLPLNFELKRNRMDSDLRMVELERLGDWLWVSSRWRRLDLRQRQRIAAASDRITETGTTVVVGLGEAFLIDSTVIRTLGSMERGEDLLLVVPAPGAGRGRALELTGVCDDCSPVFETREAALRADPPTDQPGTVTRSVRGRVGAERYANHVVWIPIYALARRSGIAG